MYLEWRSNVFVRVAIGIIDTLPQKVIICREFRSVFDNLFIQYQPNRTLSIICLLRIASPHRLFLCPEILSVLNLRFVGGTPIVTSVILRRSRQQLLPQAWIKRHFLDRGRVHFHRTREHHMPVKRAAILSLDAMLTRCRNDLVGEEQHNHRKG